MENPPAIIANAIGQNQVCGLVGIRDRNGTCLILACPPLQIPVDESGDGVCIWVRGLSKRVGGNAVVSCFKVAKEIETQSISICSGRRFGRRRPSGEAVVTRARISKCCAVFAAELIISYP